MTKQFPADFKNLWRECESRNLPAWVSAPAPLNELSCQNCGGSGQMSTQCAIGPATKHAPLRQVGHYSDDLWWPVKTYTAPCPVCTRSNNGSQ